MRKVVKFVYPDWFIFPENHGRLTGKSSADQEELAAGFEFNHFFA